MEQGAGGLAGWKHGGGYVTVSVSEWTDGRVNGRVEGRMDGYLTGLLAGWIWMDGRIDGSGWGGDGWWSGEMEEWANGW